MSPIRKKTINGYEVKEFYWAGRYPTYVDNFKTEETFEEACDRLANQSLKLDGHKDISCSR